MRRVYNGDEPSIERGEVRCFVSENFQSFPKQRSKHCGINDKVGLLKPAFVDSFTGYRYYTNEQLETMHRILMYKRAGSYYGFGMMPGVKL